MIGVKIELSLSIGGNDFFPKCHQISHDTVMKTIIQNQYFRANLFLCSDQEITLNEELFVQLYETLYCPKKYVNTKISYEEVRALTITKKLDAPQKSGVRTADPRKWLPPESAVLRLAQLMNLQIKYLETMGTHNATLPNFLQNPCLRKSSDQMYICTSVRISFH
ncbi:hypothetical protein DPMN_100731 [Dreissena polymorpha]|uniref:Uncharacterized protein n=1 Tax=Dreissena polymorpha TaxID=45954 RepID=A0A9D4LGA3_DREPO|nr:hypothetical protein DPMN_100731 [Dreissena polymorpha]